MKGKTTILVPKGRGKRWWSKLSPEQKKAVTYPRLEQGDSNKAIGGDLGITPNSIAGQRNKWNLGKKANPYELVWDEGKASAPKPDPKPAPPPPSPPPPIEKEKPVPPEPLPPRPPEPPKAAPAQIPAPKLNDNRVVSRTLAASEATQCPHRDEDRRRCGYECLPGHSDCGREGHEK